MATTKPRSDKGQRMTRTRSAAHAARTNKGHPKRQERIERARMRLIAHVYDPKTCGKQCPKRTYNEVSTRYKVLDGQAESI